MSRWGNVPAEYHVVGPYYSGWAYEVEPGVFVRDRCIGVCEHDYEPLREAPDGTVWRLGGSPIGRIRSDEVIAYRLGRVREGKPFWLP